MGYITAKRPLNIIAQEFGAKVMRRPQAVASVTDIMQKKVNGAVDEFLADFEKHKVTQEIENGNDSPNISGTLTRGNLFSFIGFREGDAPISKLRGLLYDKSAMGEVSLGGYTSRSMIFNINRPTSGDFDEVAEYPDNWMEGSNWLYGIENGIPNISQYTYSNKSLRDIEGSRSKTGIQNKKLNLGGAYMPPAEGYVLKMLADFQGKVKTRIRQ